MEGNLDPTHHTRKVQTNRTVGCPVLRTGQWVKDFHGSPTLPTHLSVLLSHINTTASRFTKIYTSRHTCTCTNPQGLEKMTNPSTVHDKATQYNTNPDELPQVGLEPMTRSVLGMYSTNKATEAAQKAEFKSPIQIKAKQSRNCVHLMNW